MPKCGPRSKPCRPRRDRTAEYKRAISILGHIAAARGIWLYRLGATPAAPTVMFPKNLLLADVARQLDGIQRLWGDYLAKLTDEAIDQPFEYQSLDAGRFRNRIEEILTQLYGHSLYHRGQIALLVKQAGGKPAMTDFVYSVPASRSASRREVIAGGAG